MREYVRDKRSPTPKSSTVSHVMSRNRAKNTKPELTLRKALWAAGLRGYRLHPKNVPGRPDIAFIGRKLAIFVHGCFWHRCPKCTGKLPNNNRRFWLEKFKANIARDARNATQLRAQHWSVLTVWECELESDTDAVVRCVRRRLTSGANSY